MTDKRINTPTPPKDPPPAATPTIFDDGSIFVIPAERQMYRYMLTGGKILDVDSPYGSNSTDREKVLKEAQRRWGGKKDDWKIDGVSHLGPVL